MQSHLTQQRRDATPSFPGQPSPNRRRQIAHGGIQANGTTPKALAARFSVIRRKLSIYQRQRQWHIEQVFRAMKSQGFDIEDSQIETLEPMKKLALAVLIAALRVMQLVNARSGATGQKLADAMDEAAEPLVEALTAKLEGKTLRQKNPHAKGTLARLSWVVGRLGGWDGYEGRGYKPPGPITMIRGLARFDALREGWEMRQIV